MCEKDFGVCELCSAPFEELPKNYGYGYVCIPCALKMQRGEV